MNNKSSRQKTILTQQVTAVANANIALIKYWGKRSQDKNLPAVGSISVTLDALKTETTLQFDPALTKDQFMLDGKKVVDERREKVCRFLDLFAGDNERMFAHIESYNSFPTGAGLASSASGFAALAKAAACGMGYDHNPQQLSKLARRGSGSAARSIFGGFVEMKIGSDYSGDYDYAIQLYDEDYWDIRFLIAIVSGDPKKTSSTQGMISTAESSPFFKGWVESSNKDLSDMREAIANKNFERMGELAEHSCLKMHGLMMSSRPPILYWHPATLESMQTIWRLRSYGISAYFTIDAGPQIKVICLPDDVKEVKQALKSVKNISKVIESKPGRGVYLKS